MSPTNVHLIANSASELVYAVLYRLCCEVPESYTVVGPRGLPTREVRWAQYVLNDPARCACWLPHRKLNYPFMFAEFLWIFGARDDREMISYYNLNIAQFADGETFYGAYGPRWREQINGVKFRLQTDPDSRQGIVCTWRPGYNELCSDRDGDGNFTYPTSKDVPCTLTMQYLLREGRLEAGVNMRSSDAWLGLPYDLFNFAMLQRALAAELKVPVGPLTLNVGSSHLYERDIDRALGVLEAMDRYQSSDGQLGRTMVSVPAPPGLDHHQVMLAEGLVRRGGFAGRIDYDEAWSSIITMLAYRRHNDLNQVHPTVRCLLEDV